MLPVSSHPRACQSLRLPGQAPVHSASFLGLLAQVLAWVRCPDLHPACAVRCRFVSKCRSARRAGRHAAPCVHACARTRTHKPARIFGHTCCHVVIQELAVLECLLCWFVIVEHDGHSGQNLQMGRQGARSGGSNLWAHPKAQHSTLAQHYWSTRLTPSTLHEETTERAARFRAVRAAKQSEQGVHVHAHPRCACLPLRRACPSPTATHRRAETGCHRCASYSRSTCCQRSRAYAQWTGIPACPGTASPPWGGCACAHQYAGTVQTQTFDVQVNSQDAAVARDAVRSVRAGYGAARVRRIVRPGMSWGYKAEFISVCVSRAGDGGDK